MESLPGMNSAALADLNLPPVSQIGMVVQDLREGVRFYRDFLNIPRWYRTVVTDCRYRYKDRPVDMLLDIAVGYSGKTQVELIEVHSSDDNLYHACLGPDGFGFHHFGVVVDDLEADIRSMGDRGYAPLQTGTLRYGGGNVTRVAYMDTVDKAGLILELIETKAFGRNLGMPRWLVQLGQLTGDTAAMK